MYEYLNIYLSTKCSNNNQLICYNYWTNNYLRGYWASYNNDYLFKYIDNKIKASLDNYINKLGLKQLQELDI